MAKKLTLEVIKERLKEINPNIKILSKEYINAHSKLKCKCLIDGYEWDVNWNNLSNGKGCPECSGVRRDYDIKIIKEKLSHINSNIEILSEEYINNVTQLKCKCLIDGHKWSVTWHNLNKGRGCPKCGRKKQSASKSFTLNEISQKLRKINPDIQILNEKHENIHSKIELKCNLDGYKWQSTWKSLSRTKGCPECNKTRRDYSIEEITEKLKFVNPNIKILSKRYEKSASKLRCKCLIDHHEWVASWNSLSRGHGCPKCSSSQGEKYISEILLSRKVFYKEQYKFEGCKNKRSLPFDFALFDNSQNIVSLIEYDGVQHFKPVIFFGGEERHTTQKQIDQIKNTYCKENNIPLLRIPYWEKDNIESILDEWLEKIGLIKKAS